MIAKVKEFYTGFGLIIGFAVVLILFFIPFYHGNSGLNYLDNLYNSISKGSAYYIPKVKEDADKYLGSPVSVTLGVSNQTQAEQTALLFKAGGAATSVNGLELRVSGDLGKILQNALEDADAMYRNQGKKISEKYGCDERLVLFNWWKAMREMDKDLGKQKKFREGKVVSLIQKKAIEPSYNYYQVDPQKIGDRWGIVLFSLVFYVVYTLWYGFAILFMFEGWGLRLGH